MKWLEKILFNISKHFHNKHFNWCLNLFYLRKQNWNQKLIKKLLFTCNLLYKSFQRILIAVFNVFQWICHMILESFFILNLTRDHDIWFVVSAAHIACPILPEMTQQSFDTTMQYNIYHYGPSHFLRAARLIALASPLSQSTHDLYCN